MFLGIIKITYNNRTAMHFMDDRFVNLGKEVILTAMTTWVSESGTVCFVCVSVCVCVCVLACVREGDTVTQPRLVCKHIRASSLFLSRDYVPLLGLNWC